MVSLNSGSSNVPHNEAIFSPVWHSSTGKHLTCLGCHWCPTYSTKTNSPAWVTNETPRHVQYSIPGNVSLMCLSCHDGAIAPTPPTNRGWLTGVSTRGLPPKDWSSDLEVGHHPYQVNYPVDGDLFLQPRGDDPACRLPLFSNTPRSPKISVECATCHDIHAHGSSSSLRVSEERFELCLCCHREMPALNRQVYLPMQKEMSIIKHGACSSCHNK